MDWDEKLKPLISRYKNIFKAHVFEFTSNGMRTKKFVDDPEWNSWNGLGTDSYHAMLNGVPTGMLQPMVPYSLSEAKKKDIEKALSYVPISDRPFLQEMLTGSVGFKLNAISCLEDFGGLVTTEYQPVAVPLTFRSKKTRATPQTTPTQKDSSANIHIRSSEIKDLLATQPPNEQELYTKYLV